MGAAVTRDSLYELFKTPSPSSRVMVRWWWFGSTNTEGDVDQQLDAMVKAGIGGVELSCVYPLAFEQPTEYGTPRFLEVVKHASHGAKARDMRFDFTIGSGWSFGGAHISPEHASKRLRFEERAIGPEAQSLSLPGRWPGDELVAAWVSNGAMGEEASTCNPLELKDDTIDVPAGGSPRTLLVASSSPTSHQLKRASNGAEGPTLDHYSREATLHHLVTVGEPMLRAAGGSDYVTSVFCDSLEAYNSDWTPSFVQEFKKRRGYDPLPSLYHIHTMRPNGQQFRVDYYTTLSEIFEENFLSTCLEWAHQHGVKFRVQNYGAPPARISGYRYADMIEGEQWGWLKIPQSKWASSAAHHLGVRTVSSETWTWLNSPSFRARPLDFKGEAHEHILSGINQFIGHGWPSSPIDVVAPGWAFYAACAISDRNEWWSAASIPLFTYLQRLSEVMKHGEPVADIGLWMPYGDTYANFVQDHELNLWRQSAKRLGERIPRDLRLAGYDFDVIDGETPIDTISLRHKVVIVAGSNILSKHEVDRLKEISRSGVKVILVDSDDVPDATRTTHDQLIAVISQAVEPDVIIESPVVGCIHHRLADGDLYFVANTSAESASFRLRPRTAYTTWQSWDLHSGTARGGSGPIKGQLAPYEALVFVTSDRPEIDATGSTFGDIDTGLPVNREAKVKITLPEWTFLGPDGPEKVAVPHSWPQRNDGGTYSYTTEIDLTGKELPTTLVFDPPFGAPPRTATRGQAYQAHAADPFGVVASIRVNSQAAGVLWAPPYSLPIRNLLHGERNTIEVTVSSTSIPQTRNGEWRRIYTDAEAAHGRRFIMQDIDEGNLGTDSGILVVPYLC